MKHKKNHILRTLRWLKRIRHRCGYGIHSPFAYGFVTDVVYNPGYFYAYDSLRSLHHNTPNTPLRLKDTLMIFRLANFIRPDTCRLINISPESLTAKAIITGSRHTVMLQPDTTIPASLTIADKWENMVERILKNVAPESAILLIGIDNSRLSRKKWRDITKHNNAYITFDLGDFGIIFNTNNIPPQNYIINYY